MCWLGWIIFCHFARDEMGEKERERDMYVIRRNICNFFALGWSRQWRYADFMNALFYILCDTFISMFPFSIHHLNEMGRCQFPTSLYFVILNTIRIAHVQTMCPVRDPSNAMICGCCLFLLRKRKTSPNSKSLNEIKWNLIHITCLCVSILFHLLP